MVFFFIVPPNKFILCNFIYYYLLGLGAANGAENTVISLTG